MLEEDRKWIDACLKAAETVDDKFEFGGEVLTKFGELFDQIVYDWPFDEHLHPKMRKHDDGFEINKTFIYKRDGKFYQDYKTDHTEITEELFEKTAKLFELLYGDEDVS